MRLRNLLYPVLGSLFATFFVLPAATHAQATATIRGTLTDPSGAAVTEATIAAQSLDSSAPIIKTRSGPDGSFLLTLVPGRYRISIHHRSFTPVERDIALVDAETKTWDVRLTLERMSSTVVVTDTAQATTAETAPNLVDVITKQEIDERQEILLSGLLASEQGTSFSRLGPGGGVTSFFLDGGNSNYTKFLVDGTPVNEPGGDIDLSSFTIENVDKIEIVHGATSALYGSDAMDGVVQIFTHRGATSTPQLTLDGDGGTFGTGHGGAQLSGLLGAFDYSVGGGYVASNGQGPDDFFRDTTQSGNFGWKFTDHDSLRLSIRNSASDAGQPGQTLLGPEFSNLDESSALHDFSSNLNWQFDASRLVAVWGGWSTHWYAELAADAPLLGAAFISLRVALVAASAATLLGTLAAVALVRFGRFRGRLVFAAMIYAPLVMPEVITGLSMLLLFVAIAIDRGFWTVVIAHTTMAMCFVAVVVQARLVDFDMSLEEAAMHPRLASAHLHGGDAAADRARHRRELDARLRAVARRSGHRQLHHRSGARPRCRFRIIREVRVGVSPEMNAVCSIMVAVVGLAVIAASLLTKLGAAKGAPARV